MTSQNLLFNLNLELACLSLDNSIDRIATTSEVKQYLLQAWENQAPPQNLQDSFSTSFININSENASFSRTPFQIFPTLTVLSEQFATFPGKGKGIRVETTVNEEANDSGVSEQSQAIFRQILVQWNASATHQDRANVRAAFGGTLMDEIYTATMQAMGQGPFEVIDLPAGMSIEQAKQIYAQRPGVVSVEENFVLAVEAISNDPFYTKAVANINGENLWGMYSSDNPTAVGTSGTTNSYGSQAEQAWELGYTGSTKTVVGVIDSGIDYTHPDLYLNIWLNPGEIKGLNFFTSLTDTDNDGLITFYDLNDASNASFVSDKNGNTYIDAGDLLNDSRWENGIDDDGNSYRDDLIGWDFHNNDNDPYDDNNHGTHVAGTIGASGGNATGVAGVNWQTQMVALKFLSGTGSGSLSNAVKAIDYYTAATKAYDKDYNLASNASYVGTNNSWGGGGYSSTLETAIVNGAKAGNLFFVAAGNSGANNDSTASYPSNYNTLIKAGWDAVVAVASITSSGALSSFSSYGNQTVDLGAPGSGIWSTVNNGGYANFNGTSMATPHVAGAGVLYASVNPDATGQDIREALLNSTTSTSSLNGKSVTVGRLDIANLLSTVNPVASSPSLAIAATDAVQAEGNSGTTAFTFTVSRTGDTSGATAVNYAVSGSAVDGVDFGGALPTGTVNFATGDSSKTISILVSGDTTVEPNESFAVTISNPTNGATISTSSASGTIQNDDNNQPTITLAIAATNAVQNEGNSGTTAFTFTVSRTGDIAGSNAVSWTVAGTGNNPANATDFASMSGSISFAVGETSQVISVNVLGDTMVEADETFAVTLSNPTNGATISTSSANGTIQNDDLASSSPQFYFSLLSDQTVGGVAIANEDIVSFDGTKFEVYFDGSDVELGSLTINAFDIIAPNEILFSFTTAATIGGISADDSDILRFTATALGSTTAGSWSMYFDGSDVGLSTNDEDVDAIHLLDDGTLLVSTLGAFSVPTLSGQDEDILRFKPTSLGPTTAGSWSMYFDGSNFGLADTNAEDVDAVAVKDGDIYLSTLGNFAVAGVSGADEDIFRFTPSSLSDNGNIVAGSYSNALFFDGSAYGLAANDITAIAF